MPSQIEPENPSNTTADLARPSRCVSLGLCGT